MSPIILALLPILVKVLTSAFKYIPVVNNAETGTRTTVIRVFAAVLSLAGIVGAFMLNGTAPDPANLSDIVTTLLLAFMTFIGSTGIHDLLNKKNPTQPV